MKPEELVPEITIRGPQWPEPVKLVNVSRMGGYVNIRGWMIPSERVVDVMIPISDLSDIGQIHDSPDLSGNPVKVFLAVEAMRYRFASMYDPLLAIHASRVDPLPHQIEAVYKYVLRMPRIRFMLAHDPGAGKTIMAGLIIKELKLRKTINNVLIVVPGHLKDQWRRELKDKFDEPTSVVDRSNVDSHYGENVWRNGGTIITSIDFAKQDDILNSLGASEFDLTIVDEAHKMSASQYGAKIYKTGRYRLGETLSRTSEHLLFLTATPHRGDPENFRLFLDLLEKGFFATSDMIQRSIVAEDNPLFLRRAKEDMKDFDGRPLFVPRHVHTLPIKLSDPEMTLYNSVSRYVRMQYNRALKSEKRRNVTFALVILQRRMASSTYALLRSLERRRDNLQKILSDFDRGVPRRSASTPAYDLDAIEDMSESERWQEEEKRLALSTAENRDEMDAEIQTLRALIRGANDVIAQKSERKLRQLRETMADLDHKHGAEKILVFTESKDTLQHLVSSIRSWGYEVNTIHGGMKLEERVQAESVFRNETRIMVATEAAGEGINLQFCHLMINYDLPWNPNRLEQRMGRVHRYGQRFEVSIFNMVAVDTREGQILKRLLDKLERIKLDMSSDKVFDVISEVISDKTLSQLMTDAAANTRSMSEILQDLDVAVDVESNRSMRAALDESLATKYMNHAALSDMREKARAHKLNPEYTGEMFELAFDMAGGVLRKRADGLVALDRIPAELRRISDGADYRNSFGRVLNRYPKVSFDKEQAANENAEFVVFGHPVFEAVLDWILQNCTGDAMRGAVFTDPKGKMDGYVIFHEIKLLDGAEHIAGRRLVSHFVDASTWAVREISPSLLWDLKKDGTCEVPTYKDKAEQKSRERVLASMEEYRKDVLKERHRQAEIKQRYGLVSLDRLILDLDNEIAMLYARSTSGEDMRLPIRNKEDRKNSYERRRANLHIQIEREQTITMVKPTLTSWVRVIPGKLVSGGMHRNQDVELAGMRLAMEYETRNGRSPEDVSARNLGYDILSRSADGGVRYIEVKARAGRGRISMTPNEIKTARNLDTDYYLYVAYNTSETSPSLVVVRNPGNTLTAKYIEVRYDIDPDDVEANAE